MRKKSVTRAASRAALRLAEGLFSFSVDYALWVTVYFGAVGVPQSTYGQIWRAKRVADRFLDKVNYEVIKHAIQTARKRAWIKSVRRRALPEITEEGRKRLQAILPRYDEKRIWDGRMHLVTYDIPEEQKKDREMLREFLTVIGCGLFQKSVWITPFNPIDTLRSFIEEHGLKGTIVVSDMGKDGSIGEEDVRAMLVRVYKLEELNDRYEAWLRSVNELGEADHVAVLQYLAILKDDPQLPFSLLLPWWKGRKAYEKVRPLLEKVVNFYAIAPKLTT